MRYKLLGPSGLRVSEVALGTMTFGEDWGWGASKEESRRIFDRYVEAGGNFVDTSSNYTNGTAERFVGEFVASDRDHFVLATKYTLTERKGDSNFGGNHRKNLLRSINGSLRRLSTDYVDVQISTDGADAATNDAVRGPGSFEVATSAMQRLADAGCADFKVSVVVTRENVDQLDDFLALTQRFGAQLRLTRLRPSGRGADVWDRLHPTAEQQRELYQWLLEHPRVLTGDSFFHLSALGEALPGLNLCGAGRVVCLIDPVGDVYACPFVLHEQFKAGSVRDDGGFTNVWRSSELFTSLREPGSAGALLDRAFVQHVAYRIVR